MIGKPSTHTAPTFATHRLRTNSRITACAMSNLPIFKKKVVAGLESNLLLTILIFRGYFNLIFIRPTFCPTLFLRDALDLPILGFAHGQKIGLAILSDCTACYHPFYRVGKLPRPLLYFARTRPRNCLEIKTRPIDAMIATFIYISKRAARPIFCDVPHRLPIMVPPGSSRVRPNTLAASPSAPFRQ